ncbi:MAG: BON domain-containing protein [Caldilineaceae bacterium]
MSAQRQTRQPTEPEDTLPEATPIVEVSLEELDELTEEHNRQADASGLIDTQHTDGSTSNPAEAEEQGLVYTPPHDPPVLPSNDLQGAEVGAGFATSMEASNPDVERLPPRVDNNDLDLEEDIATALRVNSETTHLQQIAFQVREGVAYLAGSVTSEDDIAIVEYMIRDLDGVVDVVNRLEVGEPI